MNLSASFLHIERMVTVTASLFTGISMFCIGWFTKSPNPGGFREVLDYVGVPILDNQGVPLLEFVRPSPLSNFTHDPMPNLITLAGIACILFSVLKVIRLGTQKIERIRTSRRT